MTDESRVPVASWKRELLRALLVAATATYVVVFLAVPRAPLESWRREFRGVCVEHVRGLVAAVGVTGTNATHGTYLLLVGVAGPWLLAGLLKAGRPGNLGLHRPNVFGWRIIVVGWIVALPGIVWMVRSPQIASWYVDHFRRDGASFFYYYAVNLSAEHFFFHGWMLSMLRLDRRWPRVESVVAAAGVTSPDARANRTGSSWVRWVRWFGLATGEPDLPTPVNAPDGVATPCPARAGTALRRLLGLPEGCAVPILASGLLFYVIHIGKDAREALMSLPGGVALAYIALRTNSYLTPLLLHAATALTAFLMMLAGAAAPTAP